MERAEAGLYCVTSILPDFPIVRQVAIKHDMCKGIKLPRFNQKPC